MIYAKTRMKKLPETCKQCAISIVQYEAPLESFRICGINSKCCPMEQKRNGNYAYTKPDWCPLVSIDESKIPS